MESLVQVDGVAYYGSGWMRTTEAARMLGVSSSWIRMLARRGRLKYRPAEGVGRGATGYVLMYEIAQLRQNAVRTDRQRQHREHELGEGAEWLSRKEAAELLGVAEHRISKLALYGTLRSKTTPRGTKAHRLFVLKKDVERLAENAEHRRRRFLWEKDRKWAERKPNPAAGVEPEGDWLTSADVAVWLGVSVSTVSMWRKTGRLKCEMQRGKGGKKWHRKADVLELLANPEFQKHRAHFQQEIAAEEEPEPEKVYRVLKEDWEFRALSAGLGVWR